MGLLVPGSIMYIRNMKLYSPQLALELEENVPSGTVSNMKQAFCGVVHVSSITFIGIFLILISNDINMFSKPGCIADFHSQSSY